MRKFNKSHEWVEVVGNIATLGISEYAQDHLGDIVFIDLPEVGTEYEAQECFAVVDSVKATSDIYTPVAGRVVEINGALNDKPELLNEDAYAHWIVKIEFETFDESELFEEEAYATYCEQEDS